MTGTFINVGAVLAGTVTGLLVGGRLSESARSRVLAGLGLITLVVGVDLALEWRDTDPLYVLGGVLLGGLVGEALAIQARLERFGDFLQRATARHRRSGGPSRVSEAWVTASVLFCVGPLTVVGAIQDGLTGNYDVLATKSMLDGFASIALAATLGWGVALAAGTVLVVQGGISLGATLVEDVLVGEPLAALTSAGGVLIVGLALKLLDLRDVRVANFLPALVIAPGLVGLASLF